MLDMSNNVVVEFVTVLTIVVILAALVVIWREGLLDLLITW